MNNNVLDRKQAADLLEISIRTIDRYISKGVLPKQEIGGRVVIKYKDLKPLIEQRKQEKDFIKSLRSTEKKSLSTSTESDSDQSEVGDSIPIYLQTKPSHSSEGDSEVYQKLYEELQADLKLKQERLEGANYRVGQLEGLLKESVPLIEYKKVLAMEEGKRQELEELLNKFESQTEQLTNTLESKQIEIKQVEGRLEQEKLNKKIFLIILIILFLLQPLWLIFPSQI